MSLRLPAPSLIVLVGPGASGKSTWASEHFDAGEVVSSDALRAMVGAGEHDQTASTPAFAILEEVVAERMRRGITTVIDTLGFDPEARARWIGMARSHGVPAHAVVFDTAAKVCIERNEARGRTIPKTVLSRQLSRFRLVREELEEEDWDGVHLTQPVETSVVAGRVHLTHAPEGQPEPADAAHTFGLMVSRFDWETGLGETLADVARRAEAAGFRDIWVMDHFRQIHGVGRPWEDMPEAYTTLAFMAGVTSKIRLGALVTGITHRHPVVLGKMVASLDVLSGGRAMCGLGIAWDHDEHAAYGIDFPSVATRYGILEETLQMLPLLWGPGSPEFHGEHFDATELVCYPRPLQDPVPILVGGSGEEKTLRLVARYADACNVFGDPERVRHKVDVLHRHCAEVDRDPSAIEVTHLTNALAATDRRSLRSRVDHLRDRNTTAESYMSRHNAGTVDDLHALFMSFSDAGADHSIVSIPDVTTPGSLEAFADVIARFEAP